MDEDSRYFYHFIYVIDTFCFTSMGETFTGDIFANENIFTSRGRNI